MRVACSSFSWETIDNNNLLGRTYDEFGDLSKNKIVIIPREYEINLENEGNNIEKTKYSFIGMAVLGEKTPILVDGMNEKGLMGAMLHYPEFATYDIEKDESKTPINPGFVVTYLLGECENLDELVIKMKTLKLTSELVFNAVIPVHYIFSDRSGETIIIEPDEEGLSIHRNSIGVLTNSPNYLWHRQNLRNYLSVGNEPKGPQKIVNHEITEFGEGGGSGSLGLPGDYTPVSRFVRVAFLKKLTTKGYDEIDGVTKMFHNFSTVDIPEGIIKIKGWDYYEKTLCMSVMCSESLTYYFTLSYNRRISAISLEKEKDNKDIKMFDLPQKQDISYIN